MTQRNKKRVRHVDNLSPGVPDWEREEIQGKMSFPRSSYAAKSIAGVVVMVFFPSLSVTVVVVTPFAVTVSVVVALPQHGQQHTKQNAKQIPMHAQKQHSCSGREKLEWCIDSRGRY